MGFRDTVSWKIGTTEERKCRTFLIIRLKDITKLNQLKLDFGNFLETFLEQQGVNRSKLEYCDNSPK